MWMGDIEYRVYEIISPFKKKPHSNCQLVRNSPFIGKRQCSPYFATNNLDKHQIIVSR